MKKIFNQIIIFCALSCFISLNAQPYDVVWTDLVGVTVNGNTVTKTAADGWGTGGAASTNILAAGVDGWAEMTIAETNTYRMFGLSANNINAHYITINYALYVRIDGGVRVFENGTNLGTFFTSYDIGDIFRVERVGSVIQYKRNGVVFYTSLISSTSNLIVDCAQHSSGGTISNAMASFDDSGSGGSGGTGTGGGFFVNDDDENDPDIRYSDGKVVIGAEDTAKPGDYDLYVTGGILTEKVKVAVKTTADWADYVFEENHSLISLEEVEKSITEKKHLPNVPSAQKMVANGLDVAKMDATLLRQIEELWLHTIELKKENEILKKRLEALENKK